MASDPAKLAKKRHDAQGQTGAVSSKQEGMSRAIINYFKKNMKVTFAAGTVKGTCPPGGPIASASATNGLITGIAGPGLASEIAKEMGESGPTPQLIGWASGLCTAVMQGKVNFAVNKITGVCSNSAGSPGPFVGAGTGGRITKLVAATMAQLIATGLGQPSASPVLLNDCKALADYLQKESEIILAAATVQGTAPAGGGPLAGGNASGGKFM